MSKFLVFFVRTSVSGVTGLGVRKPLTHEGVPLSQIPPFPPTTNLLNNFVENADSLTFLEMHLFNLFINARNISNDK